jgi:hypothetical protein
MWSLKLAINYYYYYKFTILTNLNWKQVVLFRKIIFSLILCNDTFNDFAWKLSFYCQSRPNPFVGTTRTILHDYFVRLRLGEWNKVCQVNLSTLYINELCGSLKSFSYCEISIVHLYCCIVALPFRFQNYQIKLQSTPDNNWNLSFPLLRISNLVYCGNILEKYHFFRNYSVWIIPLIAIVSILGCLCFSVEF